MSTKDSYRIYLLFVLLSKNQGGGGVVYHVLAAVPAEQGALVEFCSRLVSDVLCVLCRDFLLIEKDRKKADLQVVSFESFENK